MEKLTKKVKRRLEKVEFSRIKKAALAMANTENSLENSQKETAINTIKKAEEPGLSSTLYNIYHLLCGTKPRMIIFSIVIIVFSVLGVSKLVIDTSMVNYFPAASRLRQDINYVNEISDELTALKLINV